MVENTACDFKYFSAVVFSYHSFATYEDLLWDCMSAFILYYRPHNAEDQTPVCSTFI
jgi:hypothetical protein